MYQKRRAFENTLILLIDVLGMFVSIGIAYAIRYGTFYGKDSMGDQVWMFVIMSLVYVLVNVAVDFNYHFFRRGFFEELVMVFRAQVIFAVSWIVILFVMHQSSELSRLLFGYFFVTNLILTYVLRLVFKQYMVKVYKLSKYSNRLILITTSDKVKAVIEGLVSYNEWNRILAGIALLDRNCVGEVIGGYPVVADKVSTLDYIVHHDIDEAFIIDSGFLDHEELRKWTSELEMMGVIVDINIDTFDIATGGKRSLNRVGKYAVVTFARNIFSMRQMVAKRALDIAGSLVGMVILAVATVFVAPAIKINSKGPVFFGQIRVGKNGRKFVFYKFRSMYQDAEQRKKELMASNEARGLMFKMEEDPRITRVGKFLRKTSIDELPQFWNVLRGDMSLVGTRPPTTDEFERYEAKHKCRLSMTPGMTGLWQISGRSDIKDFDEVVKLDMEYIDNWSIQKDIKILLMTIWVVLIGKGSC